jgi:RNA polymerase sigma-70 factor (ECF subfamily)
MLCTVRPERAIDTTEPEDALTALLDRVSAGDEGALAQLYDATSRVVYGLVLRITGNTATAEELTLEVYAQVWRTAGTYSPERGTVSAWVVTLARSRAIDWLRSRQGRGSRVESPLDHAVGLRDPGCSPESVYMGTERTRVVSAAMAELAPEQRQAIELAYFLGMSQSEIASHCGLPLGTVKSRIRTGMLHLREALGPYAEGL